MKTSKLLFLYLLSALFFTTSCSDDDEEGGLTGNCVPTKIVSKDGGQTTTTNITYDANNRAIKVEDDTFSSTIEYNSEGKPTKANIDAGFASGFRQFIYTADRLTKLETYSSIIPSSPKLIQSTEFEYNAAGKITKAKSYEGDIFGQSNTMQYEGYTEYTYDSKGNIAKESVYEGTLGNEELAYTIDYTYDSSINPGMFLEMLQKGLSSPNNIVTSIYKNPDGSVDKDESLSVTYKYSGNYPVEATTQTQNFKASTMTVTYSCK